MINLVEDEIFLLYPCFQVLQLFLIGRKCERFQRYVVISSFLFTPPPMIIVAISKLKRKSAKKIKNMTPPLNFSLERQKKIMSF